MHRTESRRTTLTLPTASLDLAERIAKERQVNLSAVVSDALRRGLEEQERLRRGDEVIAAYQRVFAGFSEEEMRILDGYDPEEFAEPQRTKSAAPRRRGGQAAARKEDRAK